MKITRGKIALFLSLLGLIANVSGAGQNSVVLNKAFSKRFVPLMNREVAFIGLGTLEIGRDWGVGTQAERSHPSNAVAQQTLSTAYNMGFTVFDTANAYHLSQQRVGEYLLTSGNRNQVLLESKVGESSLLANDSRCKITSYDKVYCNSPASIYDFSASAVNKDVNTSLQELRTSYLDIVFIHFGPNPQKVLDNGETVAELNRLKKEGKIRYIGASIDDPALAIRCIESGDFDAIELEYNILNQSNAKAMELAHQKGMAVIVRGGLGTGLLTPKVAPFLNDPDLPYHNQVKALLNLTHGNYQQLMALELAFLYSNPNISAVIVGASNPTELKEDVQLLNTFNNPDLVQQASALMQKYPTGPFTDSVNGYFAKKLNN